MKFSGKKIKFLIPNFKIKLALTSSAFLTSDGSGSKFFDPGWVRSAIYGLGLENFS